MGVGGGDRDMHAKRKGERKGERKIERETKREIEKEGGRYKVNKKDKETQKGTGKHMFSKHVASMSTRCMH